MVVARHAIKDEDWDRIKDLLPGQAGQPGVTAKDNRLFIDAVLWIAKTGAPWRDLPERFGDWNNTWRRFDRWARKGVWQRVFTELREGTDAGHRGRRTRGTQHDQYRQGKGGVTGTRMLIDEGVGGF